MPTNERLLVLDCTLRDGGYYTNWDFDPALVETYLKAMEVLPVDIIEVGYRSVPLSDYRGEFYYCPLETLQKVKQLAPSKRISVMLNEKDVALSDVTRLLAPVRSLVDMVRLAVKPERFDQALSLAKAIQALGFDVGFNLMYLSEVARNQSVLEKLSQLDGVVASVSLVDSYGGAYPEEVRTMVAQVRGMVTARVGFHGHDNMELAFANTMAALEGGCGVVDATITGMGRGAGNTKTELLLTWLSANEGSTLDFHALSDVVLAFESLQSRYGWGARLPYMVSGAHSLPQQEVMGWMTSRYYSMSGIIQALQNQVQGGGDAPLPVFAPAKKRRKALLIAGGSNAVRHAKALKQWIERNREEITLIFVSARNIAPYLALPVPQVYCLVADEGHRLEAAVSDCAAVPGVCVLPPSPRVMGSYIPKPLVSRAYELSKISFTDRYMDSHTALALQAAIDTGATELYLAGYDGYGGSSVHQKDMELSKENEYLFEAFVRAHGSIRSLTPTEYAAVEAGSVYQDISNE